MKEESGVSGDAERSCEDGGSEYPELCRYHVYMEEVSIQSCVDIMWRWRKRVSEVAEME